MNYEQGGEQEQPRYRGENEEQEALVQEQRFIDEDVQKNRARTEKENEYFSSVIENLRDLTEKCDVPDSWPLSAVLNYLGGDNPLDEFIDDAPLSSKFYRRPEMMLGCADDLRNLVVNGHVAPDMSFAEALDVLEKKRDENQEPINRAATLDARDKKRQELSQFLDLCSYLDEIPKDLYGDLKAERHISIRNKETRIYEDRLVVTLVPNKKDFNNIMTRLKRVPRASVEREGKQIILSMVVEKRFLDVARESFPWISEVAHP